MAKDRSDELLDSRLRGNDAFQTISVVFSLLLLSLLLGIGLPASADEALWSQLKEGGYTVLIRHATTDPGIGDPPGFKLEDCSTQRNLSQAGREEAKRLGEAFRSRKIPVGQVLSSRWCRCLETARLAFGKVEPWPMLDSLFHDTSRESEQTREVRNFASKRPAQGNTILVTHGNNILALLGFHPEQGEMVIVAPEGGGNIKVVGRIPPYR